MFKSQFIKKITFYLVKITIYVQNRIFHKNHILKQIFHKNRNFYKNHIISNISSSIELMDRKCDFVPV